jgi:anti-anti-sigma regulatory factor
METLVSVRRPVRELRPGDHSLLVYHGDEEQRHVIGSFVGDGLAAGDKVICLAETADAPVPGLLGVRPPALTVVSLEDVRRSGRFGPRTAMVALAREISRAEKEGYRDIRVTADMTWALRLPGGLPELMENERHIEATISPSTCVIAVCQLDGRRIRLGDLDALRDAHTVHVIPNPEFEDSVLRIVRTFKPTGLALIGELDASRHTVLDEVLTTLTRGVNGSEIHLDLSGLGFIDLGALNIFADVAARRAGRGPLVLDRMSPQLRTVMETVGWHMLPGLRLGEAD